MGSHISAAGRFLRIAGLVCILLFTGVLPCLGPVPGAAQEYEAMMPESLRRELHKAEHAYREAIDAANAAETERVAKKAAGASADELRALDEKVGRLVTKAEKLKVQADYLDELYDIKSREYRNK